MQADKFIYLVGEVLGVVYLVLALWAFIRLVGYQIKHHKTLFSPIAIGYVVCATVCEPVAYLSRCYFETSISLTVCSMFMHGFVIAMMVAILCEIFSGQKLLKIVLLYALLITLLYAVFDEFLVYSMNHIFVVVLILIIGFKNAGIGSRAKSATYMSIAMVLHFSFVCDWLRFSFKIHWERTILMSLLCILQYVLFVMNLLLIHFSAKTTNKYRLITYRSSTAI